MVEKVLFNVSAAQLVIRSFYHIVNKIFSATIQVTIMLFYVFENVPISLVPKPIKHSGIDKRRILSFSYR